MSIYTTISCGSFELGYTTHPIFNILLDDLNRWSVRWGWCLPFIVPWSKKLDGYNSRDLPPQCRICPNWTIPSPKVHTTPNAWMLNSHNQKALYCIRSFLTFPTLYELYFEGSNITGAFALRTANIAKAPLSASIPIAPVGYPVTSMWYFLQNKLQHLLSTKPRYFN